jgi:hypothetical protein
VAVDRTALDQEGFATLRLVDGDALAELRRLWHELGVADDDPYFTTNIHTDRATARRVDLALKDLLRPATQAALPGYEPFLAAFIFKGAHGGEVGWHPDWTYTDERVHRAYLFWCPLVDTDDQHGSLRVVPGSHRWVHGLRGSGDFPEPVDGAEELLAERSVSVRLRAGEAIVYDAAILHGSPPNASAVPRPVAAIALAPEDAGLVHFHRGPDGAVAGWAIDESWYTVQPFGEPPTGFPSLEPWDEPLRPVRAGQVLAAS